MISWSSHALTFACGVRDFSTGVVCQPQFDMVLTGQSSVLGSPAPGCATGMLRLNVCSPVTSTLKAKLPLPSVWKFSPEHSSSLSVAQVMCAVCRATSALRSMMLAPGGGGGGPGDADGLGPRVLFMRQV